MLAENCYSCHGDKKQKGGLRLDSLEAILKGGESGPAVVAGKPEESLIVEAINYQGPEMPPNGKLDGKKVAILTRWVSLGAPWPGRDRGAHGPSLTANAQASRSPALNRSLWSLQPVRRPAVPGVGDPCARMGPAGRETQSMDSFSRHFSTTVSRPPLKRINPH